MGKIVTADMITLLTEDDDVIIEHGSMVHILAGPKIGKAYRFEGVVIAGHNTYRIKITRKSMAGHFRSVEWVHPHVIGCRVHVPLTRAQRVKVMCQSVWIKVDDWIMAGIVALFPLAIFEHYHLAAKITEVVSLGMLGSGGGH